VILLAVGWYLRSYEADVVKSLRRFSEGILVRVNEERMRARAGVDP
jgi:hypothetical protein